METRLQSSEVRIPKSPQSPVSGYPTFKSSFARSLSFSTNQNKPLDLEISFRIAQNLDLSNSLHNQSSSSSSTTTTHKLNDIDDDFEEFMKNSPLKQSLKSMHKTSPVTPTRNGGSRPLVLPTPSTARQRLQDIHTNKSCSAEIEVLRLRKECQNLLEENRRLTTGNGSSPSDIGLIHTDDDILLPPTSATVEEAVLQTQVETLQWQLNQVESSRKMYHAVMEEVARFLERCYQSIETIQKNNQMARSRSVNHMFIENSNQNQQPQTDLKYRRISTNSLDKSHGNSTGNQTEQLNESFTSTSTATTNSDTYNNFTDFTWRRSPKKTPQKGIDDDAEKLSQEAFRLYRTAQSLLNLKAPILNESKSVPYHRNSLIDLKSSPGCATSPSFVPPLLQRKLNSRESRLSYQSNSTSEGSVHSQSSSSRNETDEEVQIGTGAVLNGNHRRKIAVNNKYNLPHEIDAMTIGKDRIKSVASSSADDESGFSSMNSFHHENTTALLPPPPLNSTMISNQFPMDGNDDLTKGDVTLNGMPFGNNMFVCGTMPEIKPILPILHKRWDSAPPIPPKKSLATFSSLQSSNQNDDKPAGIQVLWV